MPKYKSVLNGIQVIKAGRSRKCYHSPKHLILKGNTVLEVRVGLGWQGYCRECATEMINEAMVTLENERRRLVADQ